MQISNGGFLKWTHSDDGSARDNDARSMWHLALAIARDARVIPNVLVANIADP